MKLHVVTFKWAPRGFRETYTAEHVNALAASLKRCAPEHRFVCITDDNRGIRTETVKLWSDYSDLPSAHQSRLPSCYRRLKLFDRTTQEQLGIKLYEDMILMLDLDVVLVNDISPLLKFKDEDTDFIGWKQVGSHPGGILNGSMWLLRAGTFSGVWGDFSGAPSAQKALQYGYTGSDQAWISYKLMDAGIQFWTKEDGVLSYSRDVRAGGGVDGTLDTARIVVFHGKRKPWHQSVQQDAPWVKRYWGK